jgi:hypothetical protein
LFRINQERVLKLIISKENQKLLVCFGGNRGKWLTILIQNGTFVEDSGGTKLWQGPIYGILATGSVTIPYWERLRA